MSDYTYIKVSELYWIVAEFLGSVAGNVCTVEIRRLSDDYTWNFTTLTFTLAATTGTPVFVSGDAWKTSFTPPTEDTYIVTIINTTLSLQVVQILKAMGGDDAVSFSSKAEVIIANLALNALGEARITSIDEDSEKARKIKACFAYVRDEVLRNHPWNFAIERAAPALLTATPVSEYSYYHQLPSDCLRVISVTNDQGYSLTDSSGNPLWRVEGRRIASNNDAIYIKYIKRVTDANQYDANFVTLFAWRLAAETAYAITNNKTLMKEMMDVYEIKLSIAQSVDAQESSSMEVVGDDDWPNSRE